MRMFLRAISKVFILTGVFFVMWADEGFKVALADFNQFLNEETADKEP